MYELDIWTESFVAQNISICVLGKVQGDFLQIIGIPLQILCSVINTEGVEHK